MSHAIKQALVKSKLLAGFKLTSFSLAKHDNIVDGRKFISNLRKEGLPVVDEWIYPKDEPRYKQYWIDRNVEVNTLPQ